MTTAAGGATSAGEATDGMIWEIDEKKQTIEGLDADGRADHSYATALGLLSAPLGRRALAATYNGAIWFVLQLPLWIGAVPLLLKLATGSVSPYGFLNHPGFVFSAVMAAVTTALTLVYCVVQLLLCGLKGVTIGSAITGIRSVNVRTLERPGVGAVFVRFAILMAAGIVPALGPGFFMATPMFDSEGRGRGWHDKATNIWLVDVRRGVHPYDEKQMRVARKLVKAEPTSGRPALPSLATPVNPGAQPEYRPGSRVSAGVLGVARPYEAHERPMVGLPQSAPVSQVGRGEAGKPVLGGYRTAEDERADSVKPPVAIVDLATQAPPVQPVQAPVPQAAPVQASPVQASPAQTSAPQPAPAPPAPVQPAPEPQAQPAQARLPQAPAPQPQPVQTPVPLARHAQVSVPDSETVQAATLQPQAAQPQAAQASASQPEPAQASASQPQPAPTARFGLRLDTGESVIVTEPVLLGRDPDASGRPGARAIALADDSRSLSKTHLLVRPVDGGLEIVDCRSTNGSGVIRDGTEYGIAAEVPVTTTDGDMIRIGDRMAAVVRV